MASASKIRNGVSLLLTNACRLLLAAIFIVSGFVKAVDPKGFIYKLQDYATAFSLDNPTVSELLMPAALLLCGVEFVLGTMLLMGTSKRFSTVATLAIMLFFTPWTLVLAIWNPVQDCGCFGDAFKLTNWETFFKNLVLLLMAAYLWVKRGRIIRFISPRGSWLVTLFALLYIGTIEYWGMEHLPLLDFRPFAVGSNLNDAIHEVPAEYETLYRYEKDGEVLELREEGAPDSTWNYLGTRSDVISEGIPAKVQDFWIADMTDGVDISEKLLADTSYTCLLIVNRVESADESRVDKINDIYDYCLENKMGFFAITSSLDEDIELWSKRTGAEYSFYTADNLLLKTMIRSNPGVLVLKNGHVVAKWNIKDAPEPYGESVTDDTNTTKQEPPMIVQNAADNKNLYSLFHCLFMYTVPLMMIFLLDISTRQRNRKKETSAPSAEEPLTNEIE